MDGASLTIHNSTISSSQGINLNVSSERCGRDPLELLKDHVAFGALFNSGERFDSPKCHPQTRVSILDRLDRWAQGQGGTAPVMWIRGAAGAGKSAIAQTLAQWCKKSSILAASFFFSRHVQKRNGKRYLLATLVHQIWTSFPFARASIEGAIKLDTGIFEKDLRTQIEVLIVEPLSRANSLFGGTKTVVIDGLDECSEDSETQDHEEQQREILDAILSVVSNENKIPLRFLIASRPERQIRECFKFSGLANITIILGLCHTCEADADIKHFLECHFEEMKVMNNLLPASWPGKRAIFDIVSKSSGHFIFASTAIKFIRSPRRDPQRSLQVILEIRAHSSQKVNPFAELDALYTYILSSVSPDSLPHVLYTFRLLTGNLKEMIRGCWQKGRNRGSVTQISKQLLMSTSEAYMHLVDLHSILAVPESPFDQVYFIHASFSDFLTSSQRSGQFCIINTEQYRDILLVKHLILYCARPNQLAVIDDFDQAQLILCGTRPVFSLQPCAEIQEMLEILISMDGERVITFLEDLGLQGNLSLDLLKSRLPLLNAGGLVADLPSLLSLSTRTYTEIREGLWHLCRGGPGSR